MTAEGAAARMRRHDAEPPGKVWWEWPALVLPALLLCFGMYVNRGYLKDDAFIAFRYARNLVDGHGMVFNIGERAEGYTNFLWILLHALMLRLGQDPVLWSKLFGAASSLGTMLLLFSMARWLNDKRFSPLNYIAPFLLASSSSVALWSMSGIAPCLVMFFGTAAAFGLWKAVAEDDWKTWAWTGLAMAGAALVRPEGHLFFLLGLAWFLGLVLRKERAIGNGWVAVLIFMALMVPYHGWRYLYFGQLLPLTYYVKAHAGPEVWHVGVKQLHGFLVFNLNYVTAAAAVLSLVPRRRRRYRLVAVLLWLFFMLYLVKVGRDEMKYYRLFLPALGMFVLSAGEGLRSLWAMRGSMPRVVVSGVLVAFVLVVGASVTLTLASSRGHRHSLARMRQSSMAMGQYILARSTANDRAIFQDMGACPYAAYPVTFVDTIGLLNPFIASELAAIRLNPFLRYVKASQRGGKKVLKQFDRKVRDYLFDLDARWVGMVAYVGRRSAVIRASFANRLEAVLATGNMRLAEQVMASRLRRNTYNHGMYADPRFAERYRLVKVWKRSRSYYLALFERI